MNYTDCFGNEISEWDECMFMDTLDPWFFAKNEIYVFVYSPIYELWGFTDGGAFVSISTLKDNNIKFKKV